MNMEEREAHKRAGRQLYAQGGSVADKARGLFMVIEAHYARNERAPGLAEYASHWLCAQQGLHDRAVIDFLMAQYPPPKQPRIQPGLSDWDSYGEPEYKGE